MRGTGANGLQSCNVLRRTIALVAGKTIFRILLVQLDQLMITGDLGNDAGCRDGVGCRIALDDGHLLAIQAQPSHRIDQEDIRRDLCCRLAHGLLGRLQDVDLFDLLRRGLTDAYIQSNVHDLLVHLFSAAFGQLLAVVDPGQHRLLRHHDAGRHHIASQRAASDLVDARHHADELFIMGQQHLRMGHAVNLRHVEPPQQGSFQRRGSSDGDGVSEAFPA